MRGGGGDDSSGGGGGGGVVGRRERVGVSRWWKKKARGLAAIKGVKESAFPFPPHFLPPFLSSPPSLFHPLLVLSSFPTIFFFFFFNATSIHLLIIIILLLNHVFRS